MQICDVIIVGCGPAGLSAAIYTSRAQLKTLIFGDPEKGNIRKAHSIANYLGFPQGTTGPELSKLGLEQAKKFETEHILSEIVDISPEDDGTFTLKDDRQEKYGCKAVIISTGLSYTLSGIKNEQEFTGKGVSYCVNCDGFFFRNKKLCVIGDGNYAAEEAIQLLNYTKDITIVSHGKEFVMNDQIKEHLKQNNIRMVKTERVKEIAGTSCAERLIFSDGTEMVFDGLFMAIGTAGATDFAKKLGIETEGGYIKIDAHGNTNIKGIYGAGDCTGGAPQVATSVGGGCNAALSAIKFIRGVNIYIQYS